MHHHGAAGDSGVIQGVLVLALVVTAAVHLGGRFRRDHQIDGYLLGHALMTAGMAWMLFPESWAPRPLPGWGLFFAVSGGWFVVHVVRCCGRSLWKGALRYGDLVVGHGAMAYMVGPASVRFSPVTAILIGYFLLLGLAAVAIVLERSVTIELPQEVYGGQGGETPLAARQVRRFTDSVATTSAFAHASMAVGMVYMLARL